MRICGFYAGLLAVTEVGLGGALHAGKIPFRGQFLSLNQIFLLSKASAEACDSDSRFDPMTISCAAAILKTLSPAGTKLTPMIAIAMQGFLYSLGTCLFGHTLLGRLVGAILCSFWAFFQHFFIYFVVLSSETLSSPYIPLQKITYVFGSLLVAKAILAAAIVLAAPRASVSWFDKYIQKNRAFLPSMKRSASPLKGALRELSRPLFLGIVVLSGAIAFAMTKSWIACGLAIARPLIIGFFLFFIMRLIPLEKIVNWARGKKWMGLDSVLEAALSFFSDEIEIDKIKSPSLSKNKKSSEPVSL